MIRALVLDDEPIIAADVAQQLNARTGWQASAVNRADDARAHLRSHQVDVVFLDIEMPGTNGMELLPTLKKLQPGLEVVFVTAFPEYAAKAFRVSAADYVVKPVARHVLNEACGRIEARLSNGQALASDTQFIEVTSYGRTDRVPVDDILLVRAERNYAALVVPEGEHLYRATLKSMEANLAEAGMLRCHRSFMVRMEKVRSLIRLRGQLTELRLFGGKSAPVGAAYRSHVMQALAASRRTTVA